MRTGYERRRSQLLVGLTELKLEGLIVIHPPNLLYLTGFTGSAGLAFFSPQESLLWVDGRYALQARLESWGVTLRVSRQGTLPALTKFLRKLLPGRVGFETDRLTYENYVYLRRELPRSLRLQPVSGMVERLRQTKGPEEIEAIRRAGHLTAEVFTRVRSLVRPGIREREVAAEIEYLLKREGAEGPAFETIVAAGPRSALPHARPSDRTLGKNELVLMDLGAILTHYRADMTRTLFLGKPDGKTRRIYHCVREAQQQALRALRPGVRAEEVDRRARAWLGKEDLDRFFVHSTGHGLGLEIHELPRLARHVRSRLAAGSVVTVEPGVYLPGWGGMRIEDTVLVADSGPEILTPADKTLWTLE